MLDQRGHRQHGIPGFVTAKGCPYEATMLMLKGGTGLRYMDQSVIDSIVQNPEVEKVTPMLMQAIFDPNKGESGGITTYLGVDPSTYPQAAPIYADRQPCDSYKL